jgi:hypothetical protein
MASAQPVDLALAQLQTPGCLKNLQPVFDNRLNDLDPLKLVHADRDETTWFMSRLPG